VTLSVTIAGIEVATTGLLVYPEAGIVDLMSCADGSTGDSLLKVEDIDESMSFQAWDPVIAEESACALPRCFTGYVYQIKITRHPGGLGRIWELQVVDLNALLSWRVFHTADANRPAETGTERLDWLMTTAGMAGIIFDNGQIMANAWAYDAADYRGQTAYDVLNSIISASAVNRWLFFVYWDASAASGEEVSLFYGDVSTTTYDSTMAISNVRSDLGTLVIPPWADADLTSDGTNIYDGMYVDYTSGKLYQQRTSTFTAYGVHRDGVMSSIRINNATTALRHANTWLDVHSAPIDTVTCVVRLPRSQVNLIDAGMRLGIRFSHLPGYETQVFTRVARRTFTFAPNRNTYYDVKLTMNTRGINQTGGGDPGDFPHQVICQTAALVQSADSAFNSGAITVTLGTDPTPGNLLRVTIWAHTENVADIHPPAGLTGHPDGPIAATNAGGSNADGSIQTYYRIVEGGDSAVWVTGAVSVLTYVLVEEFAGSWELSDHDFHTDTGVTGVGDRACAMGSVDVAGTALVLGAALWCTDGGTEIAAATYSINSGTVDYHGPSSVIASGPSFASSWQATSTTGTISPVITQNAASARAGTVGLSWSFVCTQSAASNPPTPGQPFGPVIPEETPNGVITTFTLPAGYEFADGSLRVDVDLMNNTPSITSYDGAARTFTLAFAPLSGELVQAYGQGR
jgi:hypothetical protein